MSIKLRNPYILLLIFSSTSLAFAYFVEYIMGFSACSLCVYQRFPYLIFIALSLISLSTTKNYIKYYIITAIFAILLAFYHTGIEREIFELSSFCKPLILNLEKLDFNDFIKALEYNNKIPMCNKPTLIILGLSMTEWNLLCNIILLILFVKFRNVRGII